MEGLKEAGLAERDEQLESGDESEDEGGKSSKEGQKAEESDDEGGNEGGEESGREGSPKAGEASNGSEEDGEVKSGRPGAKGLSELDSDDDGLALSGEEDDGLVPKNDISKKGEAPEAAARGLKEKPADAAALAFAQKLAAKSQQKAKGTRKTGKGQGDAAAAGGAKTVEASGAAKGAGKAGAAKASTAKGGAAGEKGTSRFKGKAAREEKTAPKRKRGASAAEEIEFVEPKVIAPLEKKGRGKKESGIFPLVSKSRGVLKDPNDRKDVLDAEGGPPAVELTKEQKVAKKAKAALAATVPVELPKTIKRAKGSQEAADVAVTEMKKKNVKEKSAGAGSKKKKGASSGDGQAA